MKILASFVIGLVFLFPADASGQQSDRDRGIDLYREGKFTEAIESLEKSVAADKTDRAAWLFLAGSYVHTGNEDKASEAFESSKVRAATPQPKHDRSVRIISKPRPRYTHEARTKMQSGIVRVAIEFRSDGTIGFVFPLKTDAIDLIRPSLEAAKGIRFEPALQNGAPVTVINFAEYGYSIGDRRRIGVD